MQNRLFLTKGILIFIVLIVLLIATSTRTSMLVFTFYLLVNFKRYYSLILSFLLFTAIIFFSFEDEILPFLSSFLMKASSISSITDEPRELAFFEMASLLANMPIFGYGFESFSSSGGLEIGALYAVEPIALVYALGILSFPILIFFSFVFVRGLLALKISFTFGLFVCVIAMPFLFTPFGMLMLIFYSVIPRRRYIYHF
jgi:hypothetical protein